MCVISVQLQLCFYVHPKGQWVLLQSLVDSYCHYTMICPDFRPLHFNLKFTQHHWNNCYATVYTIISDFGFILVTLLKCSHYALLYQCCCLALYCEIPPFLLIGRHCVIREFPSHESKPFQTVDSFSEAFLVC